MKKRVGTKNESGRFKNSKKIKNLKLVQKIALITVLLIGLFLLFLIGTNEPTRWMLPRLTR